MDTVHKILIVDDVPMNIKLLTDALEAPDYEILVTTQGETALQIAQSENVDLILLDVIMPHMDGYEVCTRLKANPATQHIPVIFITARDDEADEARGLELGGVDYITKPISPPIVQARIKTHLKLKLAYEELTQQNVALKETMALREHVERIIRHDLKSPLTGIISYVDFFMEHWLLEDEQKKLLKVVKDAGYQMLNAINHSLDLYKMEAGTYVYHPIKVDILRVIQKVIAETTASYYQQASVTVLLHNKPLTPEDTLYILGEPALCYTLLSNLVQNALEALPHPTNAVRIALETDPTHAIIHIHNQGAVPKIMRDKFFDKYTTAGKSGGTGLGTYSAKLMVETQKGHIHLDTSDETDSTMITILLPRLL
jgi:CheY-like chemotaxis protein